MNTHKIKKQLSAAYRYAYTNLALNYYSYYEVLQESGKLPSGIRDYTAQYNRLLSEYLEGKLCLEELDGLRKQVISSVEVTTAYLDCFQIYEYVMNRLERRFITGSDVSGDDGEVVSRIMGYIWGSKDNVVVNGRIQEVIGQLPIRFTRSKFYSMVNDCLSIYIGSDRTAIDNMMYVLRTEAMSSLPEDMKTGFEELYEILENLRQADYSRLTKEEYLSLSNSMQNGCEILTEDSGIYMLLIDLINDLYLMFLAKADAVVDLAEEELLGGIAAGILGQFKEESQTPLEEEITEKLVLLEGRQESFYEKYAQQDLNSEELEEPYREILKKVEILMSGSSFVSLEDMPASEEKADRVYVEQKAQTFFTELDGLFKGLKKPVVRAVMAQMLSKLPVCFNSADEIESYIRTSLESCTDIYEKEASIELLTELMESENAFI